MIGLLKQILCWIRQLGSMMLNALIDLVNLVVAELADGVQTLIDAWPIDTPELPDLSTQLQTAFAWVAWTPLPVHAGILFLLFSVSVWVAWMAVATALRWAKVIE